MPIHTNGTRNGHEQLLEPARPHTAETLATIAGLTHRLLEAIGERPDREGLLQTPERVARAWEFLTSGYRLDPAEVAGDALFASEGSGLVVVSEIEFFSLCEHHLLPFHGQVHIGYLPGDTILGLSKLARIAELYARRLQVQERLTVQVAEAIEELLSPRGVGVVIEATHLCMAMRGVQKPGATTITTHFTGELRDEPELRGDLMRALSLRRGG